jgi:ATP-dependent Clp protease, protease subunit
VSDILIHAEEIKEIRKRLNLLYVGHTGKTLADIEIAMERDNFMSAEGAVQFGLVDRIVTKKPVIPPTNKE